MRILYVVHTNAMGGSNKALFGILDYMSKKHDVMVFAPKPVEQESVVVDYCKKKNIKFYAKVYYGAYVYGKDKNLIRRFIRTCGNAFRTFRARKRIRTVIDEFKPDIVHTNNGVIDIALDYCEKKGIPHIWHLREYQDLDFQISILPSKKIWMHRIHKAGNFNIAITKGIFNHFNLRKYDRVIYDGPISDNEVSNHNYKSLKEKYFLFVAGSISNPTKGLYDAIKAFSQFNKTYPSYTFIAVGLINENEYLEKIKDFINKNNLASDIKFLGLRNDVAELMKSATATIVPSNFEAFGFVTAEAMSNYCIVIGRDTAGTKEQFDNGLDITGKEIGLRFTTINELSSQMSFVASDKDIQKLDSMKMRAKKVVTSLYTEKVSCYNLEKYYNDIITGNINRL